MRTQDVRVDTKLNKAVWSKGVRYVWVVPLLVSLVQSVPIPFQQCPIPDPSPVCQETE